MSLEEIADIYLPLSRLLNLHVRAARNLNGVTDTFLGQPVGGRTYVIAIAGSVAVGKSTFARVLRALMARWPDHPEVDFVTTDGFLYPLRELQAKHCCSGRRSSSRPRTSTTSRISIPARRVRRDTAFGARSTA